MKSKSAKPAAKPAMPMMSTPIPRRGTKEHRDLERSEFNKRLEAQKSRQRS